MFLNCLEQVLVMKLKRLLLLISLVLLSCDAVYAQEGLSLLQVPAGSISSIDTEIEATVENWGYDTIFVALPEGWTINTLKSGITRSYPVREEGLWRIYGMPASLGKGYPIVYGSRDFEKNTLIAKYPKTVSNRQGWWLRPNEGIYIDIYVDDISVGGGTIDPVIVEKENPSIRVQRWYESFTIDVSSQGFITAPWVVEGAALVESNPAPYSSSGNEGAELYYEKYQKEVNVADAPAWNEWFDLKNPLVYKMTDTRLAPINLEFPSIEEGGIITTTQPVWKVDIIADITYAYEWKSTEKVEGMTLWRDAELDIPEWFELF